MSRIAAPFVEGFVDSLLFARSVVRAFVLGSVFTLRRLFVSFAHKRDRDSAHKCAP